MKTIKFLFLLIIIGLSALLIYQNIDYFTTARSLTLDLKFNQWQWASPALPNWAFWGICFGLGLVITGMKGLVTAYGLGREIKHKDARIAELKNRNSELQSRLDVFIHDPYIKKGISGKDPAKNVPDPADSSDKQDNQKPSHTEKDDAKASGSQMVEIQTDEPDATETETSEKYAADPKTARN